MTKVFSKNDEGFKCANCGKRVEKLGYTSRDHCNYCLCSLHVDVNPGDRANTCHGLLVPVSARVDGKKGYIIGYKCMLCGKQVNNKAATDDDFEQLLKVMNGSYKRN